MLQLDQVSFQKGTNLCVLDSSDYGLTRRDLLEKTSRFLVLLPPCLVMAKLERRLL